jgi:uroporphyrinogen III methyltransferase/synthase
MRDRRVVVTRAQDQAVEMARLLEERGAVPVIFPTIAIVPPKDWGPVDRVINRVDDYDVLIFTSANGVKFFFDRATGIGKELVCLKDKDVWAIGASTKDFLEAEGVNDVLVPPRFVAESLLDAIKERGVKGKHVLLPRAEKARNVLPDGLRAVGALVDVVEVYRTITPDWVDASLKKEVFDAHVLAFTSPSTVRGFLKVMGSELAKELLEDKIVASIGPITSQALRGMGFRVDVEARDFTIHGLVRALEESDLD